MSRPAPSLQSEPARPRDRRGGPFRGGGAGMERGFGGAPLLAEVEPAGQLPDEDEVPPLQHFRLERRGTDEAGMDRDRSQVGEQPERAAQIEQTLFRPHGGPRIPLRAAHRAEEDRGGALAKIERRGRKGGSGAVDG